MDVSPLSPVAIALELIDLNETVRLVGIDLDTGRRVQVVIDEPTATDPLPPVGDLILTLTIMPAARRD